jgi:hypothetical protein
MKKFAMFLSFSFLCCSQTRTTDGIPRFVFEDFPWLKKEHEWKLHSIFGSDATFYKVQLIELKSDTVNVANLTRQFENGNWISDLEIVSTVENAKGAYVTHFDRDQRLMFSYKLNANNLEKKFIVGKYFYDYLNNHNVFDEDQIRFLRSHIDSLREVRGHDLPELPSRK